MNEVYGISQRGKKFQVSIFMLLAGIFKKLNEADFDFESLKSSSVRNKLLQEISIRLNESHLENPEYNASTTNSDELIKVIDAFQVI